MIAVIGLMIGMYILTRMVELLLEPDKHVFLKVLAGLTGLAAVFGVISMFGGAEPTTPPGF